MNLKSPSEKKLTFAFFKSKFVRVGRLLTPLFLLGGALLPLAPSAEAQASFPRSGWRTVADLTESASLSRSFVELGAKKFASITEEGLRWAPSATNLYTVVYAPRARPTPVPDPRIAVEFQLPDINSSLGLHLHGATEDSPSHLILVSRNASGTGLLRAYRTPIWPSDSIEAVDLISPVTRLTDFPPDDWYRLTVTSRTEKKTGRTMLLVHLSTARKDHVIGSMEAVDPAPALPLSGLVALRFFASANGQIRVRQIQAHAQP